MSEQCPGSLLRDKSLWVRRETLKIHKTAPQTRIASSLSAVEIFTALYYGGILAFDPKNLLWEDRDRFIVSKGHGGISLYPILADLGYFRKEELLKVCRSGGILGSIPDSIIPGFETVNGSLGHGLGVASGMAVALKRKKNGKSVFVLLGDGELYEGAVWEAVMFAGFHALDNIVAIIDLNKICMLNYCRNVIDLEPLGEKFRAFNWDVETVDGHDVVKTHKVLRGLQGKRKGKPKVVIAHTVKGKGVPGLEQDSLCHIRSLEPGVIDGLLKELK